MILQYSIQNVHREYRQANAKNSLNKILAQYSKLLAEQGCYLSALNYIKDSTDVSNRLFLLFFFHPYFTDLFLFLRLAITCNT